MNVLPVQTVLNEKTQEKRNNLSDSGKIESFVTSQVIQRGLDKRTAKAYEFDLQQMYLWLREQQIPDLEESAAEEYLNYLMNEKNSYKKIQSVAVLPGIPVQTGIPGRPSNDYPSGGKS